MIISDFMLMIIFLVAIVVLFFSIELIDIKKTLTDEQLKNIYKGYKYKKKMLKKKYNKKEK